MGKMNIEDFWNMVNKIIQTGTEKEIETKIVQALEPYFIIPPEKYLIGEISKGIKFNVGECGKQVYKYTLQLLNKGMTNGYLCIGEINVLNQERLPHIWLELDNRIVYSGELNTFFDKENYYQFFNVNVQGKIPLSKKEKIKQQIKCTDIFYMYKQGKGTALNR